MGEDDYNHNDDDDDAENGYFHGLRGYELRPRLHKPAKTTFLTLSFRHLSRRSMKDSGLIFNIACTKATCASAGSSCSRKILIPLQHFISDAPSGHSGRLPEVLVLDNSCFLAESRALGHFTDRDNFGS